MKMQRSLTGGNKRGAATISVLHLANLFTQMHCWQLMKSKRSGFQTNNFQQYVFYLSCRAAVVTLISNVVQFSLKINKIIFKVEPHDVWGGGRGI